MGGRASGGRAAQVSGEWQAAGFFIDRSVINTAEVTYFMVG